MAQPVSQSSGTFVNKADVQRIVQSENTKGAALFMGIIGGLVLYVGSWMASESRVPGVSLVPAAGAALLAMGILMYLGETMRPNPHASINDRVQVPQQVAIG